MIRIEKVSDCRDCGLPPCVHCAKQEIHKICDRCGNEVDTLYKAGDDQICSECRDELIPEIRRFGDD